MSPLFRPSPRRQDTWLSETAFLTESTTQRIQTVAPIQLPSLIDSQCYVRTLSGIMALGRHRITALALVCVSKRRSCNLCVCLGSIVAIEGLISPCFQCVHSVICHSNIKLFVTFFCSHCRLEVRRLRLRSQRYFNLNGTQ